MFIISPRVVNTINALPAADREPISRALSREFILGEDPEQTLTPVQCMVYAMIRFYVNRTPSEVSLAPRPNHSSHAGALSADEGEYAHTA